MSWHFVKVGNDKAALKASIQGEQYCPQGIRDHLCEQVDAVQLDSSIELIFVESYGHWDVPTGYPSTSLNEAKQRVMKVKLVKWEA